MEQLKKNVVIVRGVAGSGKSTFADLLAKGQGGKIVEADKYAYKGNEYVWKAEELPTYHKLAMAEFENHLKNGEDLVIVSNVSAKWKDFKFYYNKAVEYGYQVTSLVVENRNNTKSIHNVPDETIQRMRENFHVQV